VAAKEKVGTASRGKAAAVHAHRVADNSMAQNVTSALYDVQQVAAKEKVGTARLGKAAAVHAHRVADKSMAQNVTRSSRLGLMGRAGLRRLLKGTSLALQRRFRGMSLPLRLPCSELRRLGKSAP